MQTASSAKRFTHKKMKTQKLYIVDDHELFREGIKLMLEKFKHIELIGEAINAEQFLEDIDTLAPDIVLLDIDLPGISGEEACKIATLKFPDIKIIAVSNHSEEEFYYKMLDAGARGYVAKQLSINELLSAIEHVANGEFYFSDKILKEILIRQPESMVAPNNMANAPQNVLNEQERLMLDFLAKGYTEAEIANFTGKSVDKVNTMFQHIMQKTGAQDQIQLIMYSITSGEVDVGLN